MSNQELFKERLTEMSESDKWRDILHEWRPIQYFVDDEPTTCLCDHCIKERCVIKNELNGKQTIVGNVCVKKFFDKSWDKVIYSLKRIKADLLNAPNEDLIWYGEYYDLLTDWEINFLMDTQNKRSLTTKQAAIRRRCNEKLLLFMEEPFL